MVSRRALLLLALALAVLLPGCAEADKITEPGTLFIQARRVVTMNGDAVDGGRIIVRDGKIDAVGKDLVRPPFSKYIDAGDLVVTPGFVLAATDMGMPSPPPAPQQEGVRVEMKLDAKAADEFIPRRIEHALLLDSGITTAGLLPVGDTQGVPGQISAISTLATGPSAVLSAEAALLVNGGTHAQWRKAVGDAFEKARKERETHAKAVLKAEKSGKGDSPDEPKGAMAAVMMKKRPLVAFVEGLAGWIALRDSVPLGEIDAWILDGADLWTDAAAVKDSGVKVLTFPVLGRERETRTPVNRARAWKDKGVRFAFVLAADDAEGAARLRDHVAELIRAGLPKDAALKALTVEPAAALGLTEQVGSLQKGRRADLLFWTGDPFDPTSRLTRILVAGQDVERRQLAGVTP